MKLFNIFLSVVFFLILASCGSTLVDSQARMNDSVTNLIVRIDEIYEQVEDEDLTWEEAEPRLSKLSQQLQGLNLYLEYNEGGYGYGYYRRGRKVVVKTNFTSPSAPPLFAVSSWTLTDPLVGGNLIISKLPNGRYISDKTEKEYFRINDLLMVNFPGVNSGNVNQLAEKIKPAD